MPNKIDALALECNTTENTLDDCSPGKFESKQHEEFLDGQMFEQVLFLYFLKKRKLFIDKKSKNRAGFRGELFVSTESHTRQESTLRAALRLFD